MRRPRAMVLDEVWRGLDDVDALSGPHGGPLRRTTKLILDPLVLRPVQYPACAGPVVTADGADLIAERLRSHADALRATAAWFTVLKQVRRALRITEGHPQDLYFQRCFELAMTSGPPDPAQARTQAEEVVREVHDAAAGRTTQALKTYLGDPARAAELAAAVALQWRRRPGPAAEVDVSPALAALLDSCVGGNARAPWDRLLHDGVGRLTGIRLWDGESGGSARQLGLTKHAAPQPPDVGASASTASLALPFDRTICERVFTVLQSAADRSELPAIPDLVAAEVERSCAPWALHDESLRLAGAAGVELALGFDPTGPATGSAAQQAINGRWRREGYVLQARRLAVHSVDGPQPAGPLAAIALELRTPWQPYLRRLWVRLHGRDVRATAVAGPAELWDLLDGVARSVIMDHRTRVRQALSVSAAATADTVESRAS